MVYPLHIPLYTTVYLYELNYIVDMDIPKYIMVKHMLEFYGKPSKMGNKLIIIIPNEFHKDFEKLVGKMLKFRAEEVLDK